MEKEEVKKVELENAAAPVQKVEVDPGVLKGILDKLESLEKASADKDEQIDILRQSVSRYRLEEAESKAKPVGQPTADLMIHDGKVVVRFEMVRNKYVYNPLSPNTVSGEELFMKLGYLDGSESKEIPYKEFMETKRRAKIVKVSDAGNVDRADRNGVTETFPAWEVEFVDKSISTGKHKISLEYINPF